MTPLFLNLEINSNKSVPFESFSINTRLRLIEPNIDLLNPTVIVYKHFELKLDVLVNGNVNFNMQFNWF